MIDFVFVRTINRSKLHLASPVIKRIARYCCRRRNMHPIPMKDTLPCCHVRGEKHEMFDNSGAARGDMDVPKSLGERRQRREWKEEFHPPFRCEHGLSERWS